MNSSKLALTGAVTSLLVLAIWWTTLIAAVPQGSEVKAERYYREMADEIGFVGSDKVLLPLLVMYSHMQGTRESPPRI